jgi:RAB protein geranylgeranyltransferase component A
MSAVHGGTYILGRKIDGVTPPGEDHPLWKIQLSDVPDVLSAKLVISSRQYLTNCNFNPNAGAAPTPSAIDTEKALFSCVAILPTGERPEETSLRIFQPETSSRNRTVYALLTGADTLSAPPGYSK